METREEMKRNENEGLLNAYFNIICICPQCCPQSQCISISVAVAVPIRLKVKMNKRNKEYQSIIVALYQNILASSKQHQCVASKRLSFAMK